MPENETELTELEDRLADANARVEALQAATADAAARAATLGERAAQAEAEAARLADAGGATVAELEDARSRLREATARYREARLTANPEIPAELVPEGETIEEIEQAMEAAERVVGQLRERMQEARPPRVPAGSPVRRSGPDLSGLPASEKIRLGLQQRS